MHIIVIISSYKHLEIYNHQLFQLKLLENRKKGQKVKITYSQTPCDLCIPYEGKVLTMDELQDAKDNGLFHVRCQHFAYPV